jgi:predicted ArsR family transcriptional regulator
MLESGVIAWARPLAEPADRQVTICLSSKPRAATLHVSWDAWREICRMVKGLAVLRKQLLDSTRGRIVELLRGSGRTADEVASKLGLTASAIRAQMSAMERDGVVRRAGRRPGTTRPSHLFELTPEVEQLLSSAYIPLLTNLVQVFADALPPENLETLLRQTGKNLAVELLRGNPTPEDMTSRVTMASEILNEQLGALTRVEKNGKYVIHGLGCPLAALTGKHPGVCLAIESLVSELVGAPVHECCDRTDRPRCCFEISKLA